MSRWFPLVFVFYFHSSSLFYFRQRPPSIKLEHELLVRDGSRLLNLVRTYIHYDTYRFSAIIYTPLLQLVVDSFLGHVPSYRLLLSRQCKPLESRKS